MTRTPKQLQEELFARLEGPFTGEALFDCVADAVFFIKNIRGEYVVVNQTLVARCGKHDKKQLIGRRADEIFPAPFGPSYRKQDEDVLRSGTVILNQLEIHFHPSGARGWCLTNKIPLRSPAGKIVGLAGISKDLPAAAELDEDYARVARAVQYLHTNFYEPLRVRQLARLADMSVYQFEQRLRKIFQLTAGQLIQKIRMENAMRRLRETSESIISIALACGYSDHSAFTRQFRQSVGVSPTQYRDRSAIQ